MLEADWLLADIKDVFHIGYSWFPQSLNIIHFVIIQYKRDDRWKCANVHFWFWVQLLFHALFHVRIVFITVAQNCKVKHSLMVAALNYICLLYIIAILQAMTRTIICMTLISNFIVNDVKFWSNRIIFTTHFALCVFSCKEGSLLSQRWQN